MGFELKTHLFKDNFQALFDILASTYGPGPYGPYDLGPLGPDGPGTSWIINNLEEYSKLNMLQDNI